MKWALTCLPSILVPMYLSPSLFTIAGSCSTSVFTSSGFSSVGESVLPVFVGNIKIITTYEAGQLIFGAFGGSSFEVIDNPFPDNVNESNIFGRDGFNVRNILNYVQPQSGS